MALSCQHMDETLRCHVNTWMRISCLANNPHNASLASSKTAQQSGRVLLLLGDKGAERRCTSVHSLQVRLQNTGHSRWFVVSEPSQGLHCCCFSLQHRSHQLMDELLGAYTQLPEQHSLGLQHSYLGSGRKLENMSARETTYSWST